MTPEKRIALTKLRTALPVCKKIQAANIVAAWIK